jgi:hypothetical protein
MCLSRNMAFRTARPRPSDTSWSTAAWDHPGLRAHVRPEVNRRSLQRDLKAMVDVGLLVSEGATNQLVYRMKEAS